MKRSSFQSRHTSIIAGVKVIRCLLSHHRAMEIVWRAVLKSEEGHVWPRSLSTGFWNWIGNVAVSFLKINNNKAKRLLHLWISAGASQVNTQVQTTNVWTKWRPSMTALWTSNFRNFNQQHLPTTSRNQKVPKTSTNTSFRHNQWLQQPQPPVTIWTWL